jgi:hypothetical protein
MSGMRRLAAACAAAALLSTTVTGTVANAGERQEKLRKERHKAAVLDRQAERQADEVVQSRQRLERLAAQANAALAELQEARLAADKARAESEAAAEALAAAQERTAAAHATLDEMAATTYQSLSGDGPLGPALSLIDSGDPQQFIDGVQMLGAVGEQQQRAVDELRLAEAEQIRTEALAREATERAEASESRAVAAKERVDELVAQQKTELAHQQTLLAQTRSAADQAHARASKLERQIAAARARAAAIRAAQARALAAGNMPIPKCNGQSVEGYPNGQLPVGALCPLWGAPGMMLRADAAGAFNQMSKAYAGVFGVPLCVTSSYRTYERQVELYATMPPGYAAVPGTSNHGWGLAADLCGGIQVDGSPEHQWLLSHASAYSWFHPSWAMPGGGGPHEPWHWEYAG